MLSSFLRKQENYGTDATPDTEPHPPPPLPRLLFESKHKMSKLQPENSRGGSAVFHPVGQLFRFSLVTASLLCAESLAIHPSSGINSRSSRRSASGGRVQIHKQPNANGLASSCVLRSSARSETTDGDDSSEVDIIINAINKDDNVSTVQHTSSKHQAAEESSTQLSIWPQFDDLDKRMLKIALPCIANFAINPLIGAVDLFWVNRMGNALAVAGQAAANQVFNVAFWMTSFLPSGEFVPLMCTSTIVFYPACLM